MRKYKTKVITDESQVPQGYRRICELSDCIQEQKRLSYAQKVGIVQAVKLMRSTDDAHGPVWINVEHAMREIGRDEQAGGVATVEPAKAVDSAWADRRIESAVIALCEINNGITLMQATLERLTAAVESIATQPKADEPAYAGHYAPISNGTH